MSITFPYVREKFTAYPNPKGGVITNLSLAVWLVDEFTGQPPLVPITIIVKESNKKMIKNRSGYYLFNDLDPGKYTVVVASDYYFREERICDTSNNETLDQNYTKLVENGRLEFDSLGPASGDKNVKLKDVSILQEKGDEDGDVIEFRNHNGEMENRTIQDINKENKIIFWDEGLKYDFNLINSEIRALKSPIIKIHLKPRPEYPFPNNATLVKGMVKSNSGPIVDAIVKVEEHEVESKTVNNGVFVLCFEGIKEETVTLNIRKGDIIESRQAIIQEGKTMSFGIILLQL